MAGTFLDHVDLRVADFERSLPRYDALFEALGMGQTWRSARWVGYGCAAMEVRFFAITEKADHRGKHNRIAFAAETKEAGDRVGEAIRAAGAREIEGPKFCPEYDPGYCAACFEDDDGNRFEVCCHSAQG